MEIRQPLTIDLAQAMPMMPVSAVQGDGSTRILSVTLLENGAPWQIPEAAVVDVAFRKPDGTKGIYSRLPDGSSATSRNGNVLSATMAPQMLTCPGTVLATFVFRVDGGKTLAAFPFTVTVEASPAAGAEISQDYFNPADLSDLRAELAAGLAAKAPVSALTQRVYNARGEFFTAHAPGTARGCGTATVHITPDGIARVDYAISITEAGTDNTLFSVGPSIEKMREINPNIPGIVALHGGVCTYYRNGQVNAQSTGYGGSHDAVTTHNTVMWDVNRVYEADGATGPWADTAFITGDYIVGTCYGRVAE